MTTPSDKSDAMPPMTIEPSGSTAKAVAYARASNTSPAAKPGSGSPFASNRVTKPWPSASPDPATTKRPSACATILLQSTGSPIEVTTDAIPAFPNVSSTVPPSVSARIWQGSESMVSRYPPVAVCRMLVAPLKRSVPVAGPMKRPALPNVSSKEPSVSRRKTIWSFNELFDRIPAMTMRPLESTRTDVPTWRVP